MSSAHDPLRRFVLFSCLAVAALRVGLPVLGQVLRGPARDFASYYYAGRVVREGGNPYRGSELNERSREETGRAVNPYIYPPPFLLVCTGLAGLSIDTARRVWFVLELAGLAACLYVLGRMLKRLEMDGVLLLGVVAVTFPPLYENLVMGQVNALVLLLILLGLERLGEGSERAAGALLGAAAIIKMSPALLVVWLLVRRRFSAVVGALASAVGLMLLALPVVGPASFRHFFGQLLPGFSSGFPGVALRVDWVGNHSLPSLVQLFAPGERPRQLSDSARMLSIGIEAVLLLMVLAWCLRRPWSARGSLGEASAILVLMVSFPVYVYDHHLVYLLLPIGLVAAAISRRELSGRWPALVAGAYALLAVPPSGFGVLAQWQRGLGGAGASVLALAAQAKVLAMGVLLAAVLAVPPDRTPGRSQGETR